MTVTEAQTRVDTWIKGGGGGYFSELTNLGILTEEVGELARWVVRKYGDQSLKTSEKDVDMKAAITDEIADIFWVVICLANQMDIDLDQALEANIEKKTLRDHSRHIK